MIDWLARKLHLIPDTTDREQSDAVVQRIDLAIDAGAQESTGLKRDNAALKDEFVRHYPQTDLARALLRARDGGGVPT